MANENLITERPILFQTEMVKANLDDRKTQTRRTNGLHMMNDLAYKGCFTDLSHVVSLDGKDRHGIMLTLKADPAKGVFIKYPYGKPGDLLWVRETWGWEDFTQDSQRLTYKTDGWKLGKDQKWKPSIHMPKSAARIWLMIEDIRVERLQDISEEDAIAEGIELVLDYQGQKMWKRYDNVDCYLRTDNPIVSFWSLWESINGAESWDQNPWVWVIKYRILSTTGRPSDEAILCALASLREPISQSKI